MADTQHRLYDLGVFAKVDMAIQNPDGLTTRKYVVYEMEACKDWHKLRLHGRPGITGLWQVNGYHEVSFDQSVLLDLYYLSNATWMTDLKIMAMTPLRMLAGLEQKW